MKLVPSLLRFVTVAILVYLAGQYSGIAQFILFFLILWTLLVARAVRPLYASIIVAILLIPFEIGLGQSIPTAVLEGYNGLKEFSVWFIVSYSDIIFIVLFFGIFLFRNKYRPVILPIDWFVITFILWAFFSTLASAYQPAGIMGWLTLFKGMIPYFIFRLLPHSKKLTTWITKSFTALLLFEGILGFYQLRLGGHTGRFFETAEPTMLLDSVYRPSGTLYDPNVYALMIFILLPPVFHGLLRAKHIRLRAFYLLGICSGCVGIVVSGSRFAWAMLFFSALWIFLSHKRSLLEFFSRKFHYPHGNKLFALGAVSMFIYLYPKIISPRLSGVPATLSSRTLLIQESLGVIARHPFIGAGLNGFTADAAFSPSTEILRGFATEVHNIYLLIASELGIIGLILFLLIIRQVVMSAPSPWKTSVMFYLLFGLMIPSFIRGSQFPLFMILVGLSFQNK